MVYLGSQTRYLVEAEAGTTLTVVEQNREAAAIDAQAVRGRRVLLAWPRARNRPLGRKGSGE